MSATVAVEPRGAAPAPAVRIAAWRDELRRGRASLREAFFARRDTGGLLRAHARLIDRIVVGVWRGG